MKHRCDAPFIVRFPDYFINYSTILRIMIMTDRSKFFAQKNISYRWFGSSVFRVLAAGGFDSVLQNF
jgi:hypothetical protein